MTSKEELYPNTQAIADRLNVKRKTVKSLIDKDGLPAFQTYKDGPYMITESAVVRWLQVFQKKYEKKKPTKKAT